MHARVTALLEQDFADLVERQPELLAHHLTAAGQAERAVDQWLKAGQYAAARLAHLEAIRHFDRGLATLAVVQEGRRGAGASARPRCRPSLTQSHWRRRNSWPLEDRRQRVGLRHLSPFGTG
jgi:hypothetical protein